MAGGRTDAQKERDAEQGETMFQNRRDELRNDVGSKVPVPTGEFESRREQLQSGVRNYKGKSRNTKTTAAASKPDVSVASVNAQSRGAAGGSGISKADFGQGVIKITGVNVFTPVNSKVRGR